MHIAFVDASQHEALVDLMHEMCIFYSEETPVSRDDVRANLLDNLLAPDSAVRLVVAPVAADPRRSRRVRGRVRFLLWPA